MLILQPSGNWFISRGLSNQAQIFVVQSIWLIEDQFRVRALPIIVVVRPSEAIMLLESSTKWYREFESRSRYWFMSVCFGVWSEVLIWAGPLPSAKCYTFKWGNSESKHARWVICEIYRYSFENPSLYGEQLHMSCLLRFVGTKNVKSWYNILKLLTTYTGKVVPVL